MTPIPWSVVSTRSSLSALVAEPADPGRQTLELDALAREPQPTVQVVVVGQRLHNRAVGAIDVLRFAAQRHPAEGPFALAEEGPDVGGNEPGDLKGVGDSRLDRLAAQVVAIVEGFNALAPEAQHGTH